jgi:starvation-inducible outer membrane lipoprotein
MRTALVIMALVALAGCAATPAELAAQDDATCTDYGFTQGTTDYAACRLQVAQAREDRDTMTRAALFMGRPQPRY